MPGAYRVQAGLSIGENYATLWARSTVYAEPVNTRCGSERVKGYSNFCNSPQCTAPICRTDLQLDSLVQ